MTHKIDEEILSLYQEMKKENMNLDNDMVMTFLKRMPIEAKETLETMRYGKHIVSKTMYDEATKCIKDKYGNPVMLWSVGDVLKIASNYIKVDDEDFFELDLALWANVKKGDYGHIEKEPSKIVEIAISDLTDKDYPYGDPSERAYCWAKAALEEKDDHDDDKEDEYTYKKIIK